LFEELPCTYDTCSALEKLPSLINLFFRKVRHETSYVFLAIGGGNNLTSGTLSIIE
jgi:hypothetical protein